MVKRNGGLGQPGPRTYEEKGWQAEIRKPFRLAIGLGILLNLGWLLLVAYWWADDNPLFQYHLDHPKQSVKVFVVEWLVIGILLFAKWTETFWDDDYTTLVGDHPLLGILPMRPLTRLILFFRWWNNRKADKPPATNPTINVTVKDNERNPR